VKLVHTISITADHPAFAGHFPGIPIFPGALLLDEALRALERELALDLSEWQIATAKFLEPVRPGDVISVEQTSSSDSVRFSVLFAGRAGSALAGTLSRLPVDAHDDA
jgi:3-hydroxymyristoyl/3-hydroxydecanoyl-(acyl carrier protein) dehydratase